MGGCVRVSGSLTTETLEELSSRLRRNGLLDKNVRPGVRTVGFHIYRVDSMLVVSQNEITLPSFEFVTLVICNTRTPITLVKSGDWHHGRKRIEGNSNSPGKPGGVHQNQQAGVQGFEGLLRGTT